MAVVQEAPLKYLSDLGAVVATKGLRPITHSKTAAQKVSLYDRVVSLSMKSGGS